MSTQVQVLDLTWAFIFLWIYHAFGCYKGFGLLSGSPKSLSKPLSSEVILHGTPRELGMRITQIGVSSSFQGDFDQ
jgi:hypothetical protein